MNIILNFNNEQHVQNHSCHNSTLKAFCSHGENYIRQVVYVMLNNGKPNSCSCPRATEKLMQLCGYEFFYVTLCIPGDLHQKFAPMLGLLHPNCCLGGLVRVGREVWAFGYKQSLPLLKFSL